MGESVSLTSEADILVSNDVAGFPDLPVSKAVVELPEGPEYAKIQLYMMTSLELLNKAMTSLDDHVPEFQYNQCMLPSRGSLRKIACVLFSGCRPKHVDINIKSTQRLTSLTTGSWFYIRVSVKSELGLHLFQDKNTVPHLYQLLERMQRLESESHLCIQNYVCGETCQQNLVVEGPSLVVQHEARKRKPARDSSLHLRVHQTQNDMMKECQLIYKFLHVAKIFRPKVTVQFSMKLGENICRSKYCVMEAASLPLGLPDIVAESVFYLYKTSYDAEEDYARMSVVGSDALTVRILDKLEEFNITCVGVFVPVITEKGRPSVIALTVLADGWFPVDTSIVSIINLLEGVSLSKFGLKLVSSTTDSGENDLPGSHWKLCVQSTSKHVPMNAFVLQLFLLITSKNGLNYSIKDFAFVQRHLNVILDKTSEKMKCTVRESLAKALQSWTEKGKTRTLVYKSIRSVSKAIRDIVSMSDSETFRQEILGLSQVDSTLELEKTVQSKLTAISRRRHGVVWSGSILDSQQDMCDVADDNNNVAKNVEGDKDPESFTVEENQRSNGSQEIHNDVASKTPKVNSEVSVADDVSPFHQLADDLMCAIDDMSHTDQNVSAEMTEDPCSETNLEDKLMSELFHEDDDNLGKCGKLDENCRDVDCNPIAHRMTKTRMSFGHSVSNRVNTWTNDIREDGNRMIPGMDCSEVTPVAEVKRPELRRLKSDSALKRSMSFPKDLEQVNERSTKFYRAFSGDRIVPQVMRQDCYDSNNKALDSSCYKWRNNTNYTNQSMNKSHVTSNHLRSKSQGFCSIDSLRTDFRELTQTKSLSQANICGEDTQTDICVGISQADISVGDTQMSFSNNAKPDERKSENQFVSEDEFGEAFDIISMCVDECVAKELDNIDGQVNSCHIQSQIIASDLKRNKDSVQASDGLERVEIIGETDRVSKDKHLEDSDDWFDAAMADIEHWLE